MRGRVQANGMRPSLQTVSSADITIGVDGRDMPCFLALPNESPRAAVIVLQELFGVNAEIRRIATLLAQTGYVAIAPEFFHRTHPALDAPYTAEGRDLGIAAASAVTTDNLVRDLRATIAWLQSQPFVSADRIGVWGFCMGASAAFVAAALPGIRCAICFYGAQIARPWRSGEPGALANAKALTAPLLLAFGGRDASIPVEAIREIDQTLAVLGKRYEIHVYPDADHGFFRHRSRYRRRRGRVEPR